MDIDLTINLKILTHPFFNFCVNLGCFIPKPTPVLHKLILILRSKWEGLNLPNEDHVHCIFVDYFPSRVGDHNDGLTKVIPHPFYGYLTFYDEQVLQDVPWHLGFQILKLFFVFSITFVHNRNPQNLIAMLLFVVCECLMDRFEMPNLIFDIVETRNEQ